MKRRALLTSLAVALPAQALAQKVDGGLTLLEEKKTPKRKNAPVPAGSVSIDNMEKRCTACGLCVSKCPAQVLKPSTELHNLMQTTMTFDKGYCRPECTVCSQVCPTGAILKITPEEKSAIHIGHAVWLKETCLPFAEGESCGNCARHCPVGAIRMVKISDSGLSGKGAPDENLRIPLVNESRCIGCGACEHYCPTRPLSSIYVEGHLQHRID
jgi:ferredoxin